MTYNFENLTAKIYIKKTKFFGFKKKYAIIIIVPSFVIAKIQTNIKDLPFENLTTLDFEKLLNYVKNNGYDLTYTTQNKKIKRLIEKKVENLS